MLAPHELKNKQFQKTFKGYNPQEVDEYLEFVLEKYTEAYRENNELERKLRIVVTNLDEIKDEEESIRSTLISAQKMAEKIIADANDRADIITGAIKDRCDGVIAEFREQLRAEKEKAWIMRTRIIDFKKQLCPRIFFIRPVPVIAFRRKEINSVFGNVKCFAVDFQRACPVKNELNRTGFVVVTAYDRRLCCGGSFGGIIEGKREVFRVIEFVLRHQ